ncbi:MAG: ABC transporter ATP-binding protein [Bacillota bacterium]
MNEAFSLKDVKKAYRGFLLDVKDLSLERGYVMGLVGRNGAGKSTSIKILMNLIYPDSGDVRVLGLNQPEHDMEIKRRVGYVSEEPVFYEEMTVAWMAGLVKRYYPTWDDALYEKYLRKFVLDPRRKVKELSRGMKVKLGLMLALSHRPELLILDEPTSGIDPVVRHELLQEISGVIRDEERTVLLSSHITQDIEQVADYVAIIDQGKVVECSDKESLLDRWKKVSGTLPAGDAGQAHGLAAMFSEVKVDGTSFAGVTKSFSDNWLQSLKAKGAANIRVVNVGLDEVLIALAGKES